MNFMAMTSHTKVIVGTKNLEQSTDNSSTKMPGMDHAKLKAIPH